MEKTRIETGKAPLIHITRCDGDLMVRSWAETAVVVKDNGSAELNEKGDSLIQVSSPGSLKLYVPEAAELTVEHARGDLNLKNMTGAINLQTVDGDAVVLNAAALHVETIHGDLAGKNIAGPVEINTIHGDAALRSVGAVTVNNIYGDIAIRQAEGDVTIKEASGDISLRGVDGSVTINEGRRDAILRDISGLIQVKAISGDIRLTGPVGSSGKSSLTAHGDIVLRWPENGDLALTATAPNISDKLRLQETAETDNTLTGQLGAGATHLTLQAGGRIVLKTAEMVQEAWSPFGGEMDFDWAADLDGLGQRITEQVNEQVSRISVELETRFGPEFSAKMAEKIAQKAEKAARQAEKAAEQARRRAERSMKRGNWRAPRPPQPPRPAQKATSQEQMKILSMVEKGLITPEEANTLLEALES